MEFELVCGTGDRIRAQWSRSIVKNGPSPLKLCLQRGPTRNPDKWTKTYVLLVDNRETVGEVESLVLGDQRSDLGPGLRLGGI